jgi:hypothetical protein
MGSVLSRPPQRQCRPVTSGDRRGDPSLDQNAAEKGTGSAILSVAKNLLSFCKK